MTESQSHLTDDPLAAAKGLGIGLLLSVPVWSALIAAIRFFSSLHF